MRDVHRTRCQQERHGTLGASVARRPSSEHGVRKTGSKERQERQDLYLSNGSFGNTLRNLEKTLDDVRDAIAEEDPEHRFCYAFWSQVLHDHPIHKVRAILNKTLPYWVEVYNRWQDLIRTKKAREQVDLEQFLDLTRLPKAYCQPVFESFGGKNGRGRVSMLSVLTGGVFCSRLISRAIKLKFTLGLFDADDTGGLTEHQFVLFLASLVRGLGAIFAVPEANLPKAAELRRTAERRYARIGAVADLFGIGEHREDGEALSHSLIVEWMCGSLSDRDCLSLPYRLAIDRLCPESIDGVADEFWGGVQDGFQLSHTQTVPIPETMTRCPRHPDLARCEFLSRKIVIMAREAFVFASKQHRIRLTDYEMDCLVEERGWEVDKATKSKIVEAMDRFACTLHPGSSISELELVDFFRFLSPCAQPRHVLMYKQWCADYDVHEEKKTKYRALANSLNVFDTNEQKPILPSADVARLEAEFEKLDRDGSGFVNARDIAIAWDWSEDIAKRTMMTFDRDDGRCLDKLEFLQMMCPEEFRLPQMDGVGRHLLGKLLDEGLSRNRNNLTHDSTGLFGDSENLDDDVIVNPEKKAALCHERSELPALDLEVPADLLKNWENFWATLDSKGVGRIGVNELVASGLVSQEVSSALVQLVDKDDPEGISRFAFLESMCRAHSMRMPVGVGL
eukprot:TRINITY_DN47255_c0_g1_i1.p1 TRINITY_DN47255_c0_g1~~TRINITY_DN47255_c0_g1_i1.p1  ORF type:complete len:678 (+),score=158.25 TRINITY_DN47255_c0_g1_i1:199-2232(+)